MDKLDIGVAAAGALILVVAIVGATLTGGGASRYVIVATLKTTDLPGASRAHQTDAAPLRDSFAIPVNGSNLTRLNVTVTVTWTSTPGSTGSAHATLTAPNGTKIEKELSNVGPALGSATATLALSLEAKLGDPPASRSVDARSAADALAQVERGTPANATADAGDWKLDVSFAGGPTPVPQATISWKGVLESYELAASPAVPASR